MDRFPDATAQDLARCDGICIICREEMAQAGLNKKLHCGHVFHLHCLRCVMIGDVDMFADGFWTCTAFNAYMWLACLVGHVCSSLSVPT